MYVCVMACGHQYISGSALSEKEKEAIENSSCSSCHARAEFTKMNPKRAERLAMKAVAKSKPKIKKQIRVIQDED